MTTHTLTVEIQPDELEPLTSPIWQLHCSDDGGPGCAMPVQVDDCADVAHDRDKFIRRALEQGYTREAAEEDWGWNAEAEATSCDGWWWEGHHLHHGPVGSGCFYVDWFDNAGSEVMSHVGLEPIVLTTSPLKLNMEDEGVVGFRLPTDVELKWAHQRSGEFHPYTCGNRGDGNHPYEPEFGDHGVLRPTEDGWECAFCDYRQLDAGRGGAS